MASLLERADELAGARPAEAASLYRQAALEDGTDAEALKTKESAVTKLAELLVRASGHCHALVSRFHEHSAVS